MIKYSFNISEEIARWVTEVYIRNKQSLGWWVAFTNPVAGPWKKVTAPDKDGNEVEIYRFERETERPDLVLVNDKYKLILIIEAKDYCSRLVSEDQMKKSIRVIREISAMLSGCTNPIWGERKDYTILPSFLWYTENPDQIVAEDSLVKKIYSKYSKSDPEELLNIVITHNDDNDLANNFVHKGKINKDLTL